MRKENIRLKSVAYNMVNQLVSVFSEQTQDYLKDKDVSETFKSDILSIVVEKTQRHFYDIIDSLDRDQDASQIIHLINDRYNRFAITLLCEVGLYLSNHVTRKRDVSAQTLSDILEKVDISSLLEEASGMEQSYFSDLLTINDSEIWVGRLNLLDMSEDAVYFTSREIVDRVYDRIEQNSSYSENEFEQLIWETINDLQIIEKFEKLISQRIEENVDDAHVRSRLEDSSRIVIDSYKSLLFSESLEECLLIAELSKGEHDLA